jgi:hypothetical protein
MRLLPKVQHTLQHAATVGGWWVDLWRRGMAEALRLRRFEVRVIWVFHVKICHDINVEIF